MNDVTTTEAGTRRPRLTSADLRAFKARHRLTYERLAALLDVSSVRTVEGWCREASPGPPPHLWRSLRDLEHNELAAPPRSDLEAQE